MWGRYLFLQPLLLWETCRTESGVRSGSEARTHTGHCLLVDHRSCVSSFRRQSSRQWESQPEVPGLWGGCMGEEWRKVLWDFYSTQLRGLAVGTHMLSSGCPCPAARTPFPESGRNVQGQAFSPLGECCYWNAQVWARRAESGTAGPTSAPTWAQGVTGNRWRKRRAASFRPRHSFLLSQRTKDPGVQVFTRVT